MSDKIAEYDIQLRMQVILGTHFEELDDIKDKILVVFKNNADSKGEVKIWGTTKKMPKLVNTISQHHGREVEYIFQIELSQEKWNALNMFDQKCLLIHHLCSMGVKENQASGEKRYFIRPAEIKYFRKEVGLCDYWRSEEDQFEESAKGTLPQVQLRLFNKKASEVESPELETTVLEDGDALPDMPEDLEEGDLEGGEVKTEAVG